MGSTSVNDRCSTPAPLLPPLPRVVTMRHFPTQQYRQLPFRQGARRLQALEHCTRGENAEANILLQWLCCTYRIAPQAFEDLQLSTCSLDGAPVLVYDQALPGDPASYSYCLQRSKDSIRLPLHLQHHQAPHIIAQGLC